MQVSCVCVIGYPPFSTPLRRESHNISTRRRAFRHLDHMPCMPDMVATAPSSNGYKPSFKPFMAAKDLGLGVQAAQDVGIEPVCGEAALRTYTALANDERFKDLDQTAAWLLINDRPPPAGSDGADAAG